MKPGSRLGPYEVVEPIGAGGMGEVYLALDTRLDRQVAVKVLPEGFASDPERLARFEREARAAAALNHPHIAALHDVGVEGSTHYMVQEYLQGETLRDLIAKGPVELRRAIALGMEIAEALQAAHRAGIVHRDLKPENIFVSGDGHAKVLDFGLAKLTEVASGSLSSQSMSPTVLGTQAGTIMGTAGYMAPEQVRGEDVDARADLFALGCVMWELVSGHRAFAGKSVPHTLHKILDEQPDGHDAEGVRGLPLRLRWLLDRALAKPLGERAQSAADLLAEMRRVAAELESGSAVTGVPDADARQTPAGGTLARGISWRAAVPAAVLLPLAGAAIVWWLGSAGERAPRQPWRFDVPYPGDTRIESGNNRSVAISPDGDIIAFEADEELWLRRVGDLEPTPVRGTMGARSIFFSFDGSQIGYWAQGDLMRVSVNGGVPVRVGETEFPYGASWGEDGFIYVGQGPGGVVRLPATGGPAERVVETDVGQWSASPRILAGGEWLLFTLGTDQGWDEAEIVVQSLLDGERRSLVSGGRDARITSTGHLVFGLRNGLYAQPFDLATLQVSGGPVSLIEGVRASNGNRTADLQYDLSASGDLVYVPGAAAVTVSRSLAWRDRDGQTVTLPFEPREFAERSLSPDGRRIAVAIETPGASLSDIWLYSVDRPGGQRLTDSGGRGPVWSPDGDWVYFSGGTDLQEDVWRRRADLTMPPERVYEAEGRQVPAPFGSDGTRLAITTFISQPDVALLTLGDQPVFEPLFDDEELVEVAWGLSPDGRYLLYGTNESGRGMDVYVMELASRRPWLVSTSGGGNAFWSADGSRIWYVEGSSALWEVEVTTEPEFSTSPPQRVFDRLPGERGAYVTLDGERFLTSVTNGDALEGSEAELPHIIVALDWFEELRQRVPVER